MKTVMKKSYGIMTVCVSVASLLFADTNAVIEVKLFKSWIIEGEQVFGNLAIKNTGTDPILLAKNSGLFDIGQLAFARFENREEAYRQIPKDGFFSLLPEETQVYEGRKFYFNIPEIFSEEIRFTISIYLGGETLAQQPPAIRRLPSDVRKMQYPLKEFWLDSEPLVVNGVVPDSEEELAAIANDFWKLVAVTYKNERWLYKKSPRSNNYYAICPLSPTNKIRVEPNDNENLFTIWDGSRSMIFDLKKSVIIEGPDENNVLGKWTRERKQKAEADNAEVRRKRAEAKTP